MKKLVISLFIVLAAASGAALVLVRQKPARDEPPAELVPATTLFFAELPNCSRSTERWAQTALCQLWKEPEVQAFMEKPRTKIPWMADWQAKVSQFAALEPQQAFVAATTLEGDVPQFVAGFSFGGSRADAEKALAEPRAELRKNWPAGKADIVPYRDAEIQTYTEKENTVAEVFRGNWYFIANQVDLLRATIDRFDGKQGAAQDALAGDAVFQKTLTQVPADSDLIVFGRVSVLTDRVNALLSAAGQPMDPAQNAELKKTQAVAFATKMDGLQFRDTIFAYTPGTPVEEPLARKGLSLTTPGTLLFFNGKLPSFSGVNAPASPLFGQGLPFFGDMEKELAAKNLKLADANDAFGPEFSLQVDWAEGGLVPSFSIGIGVREPAKAKAIVEALTAGAGPGWESTEKDGATIYAPPPAPVLGFALPQLAFGISDQFLVASLGPDAVANGLAQARKQGGKLSDQPAFQATEKLAPAATTSFGYFDVRALVERSSAVFRPVLAMSLAFNPDAGQYFDAGKLPATATLTKHLGPSVYSQRSMEQGTVIESAGPLTFNEAMAAVAMSAGLAVLPTLDQTLKGGGVAIWPNLFPGAAPAAPLAPAAPPASAPKSLATP